MSNSTVVKPDIGHIWGEWASRYPVSFERHEEKLNAIGFPFIIRLHRAGQFIDLSREELQMLVDGIDSVRTATDVQS